MTYFKLSRNGSSRHHLKKQFSVLAPRPAASASSENLQKCRFWGPASQLLNQKFWKGSPEIHVLTNLPYDSDPHDTLRAPVWPCCTKDGLQQYQYPAELRKNAESQAQPRHAELDSAFCQDPQGTHVAVWEALPSALGFPGGASGKEPAYQCRRPKRWGFSPWTGKIP